MVQDLYILMITAAVVSILFKFLKQPGSQWCWGISLQVSW